VDGDFLSSRAKDGLHTLRFPSLHDDVLRLRIEEEARAGPVRVREVRDEGPLLGTVDATEEAEVAAGAAAAGVPRDDLVVHTEPISEGFASPAQGVVAGVHVALLRRHVETGFDLPQEGLEGGGREAFHAGKALPFLQRPPRRSQARHPVNRRATARGLAGEDTEGEIPRREDPVALEHRFIGVRLPLGEILRRAVGTGLQDEDAMARFGELRSDDRTARAASYDADVGL